MLFRPSRTVSVVFSILCTLPLLALVALWRFQENIIFIPNLDAYLGTPEDMEGYRHPGEWGLPYLDVWIDNADGTRVHGWLMTQPDGPTKPTVVFFHGNAGSINTRLPFYADLYKKLGVNVFAHSYRGYGRSTGTPSEKAFMEDAEAVIKKLRTMSFIHPDQILVFGRSLGGAVAVDVANKLPEDVRGVIVENTFWDMIEMSWEVYAPLKYVYFLPWLLRHKFETGVKMRTLKSPVLFISGDEDELISPQQMARLYIASAENARCRWWLTVKGGHHNDTWAVHKKGYYETIRQFLNAALDGNDLSAKTLSIGREGGPPTPCTWITKLLAVYSDESTSKKKKEL